MGTTVLALTFAGGWLAWRGSGGARASSQVGRLVTFTLCALGVFALGGLAGKFPFGPTRHTYVLQGPILLAFSAALSALAPAAPRRLQAWLAPLGTLALAGLVAAGYPGFEDSIRNHFDMEAIRALARSAPGRVVIMNLPRSYTWEHHLLEDSFREPRFSMRSGEALWAASLKERPDAMVLFSHRAPLTETSRHELQQAGCTVRTVREIPPVGSTELMGNINGGNGYFLYEARCAAH